MTPQLIIDSAYGFFDKTTIEEVSKFFDPFLQSGKVGEYVSSLNKIKLTPKILGIQQKEMNALLSLNNIEGLNIKFNQNKTGGNFVYGFLPDFEAMGMNNGTFDPSSFNKNNKGKVYKVLMRKGVGEYVIADASIGYNNGNFFVKSLTPNKSSFISPYATSRLRTDGKINELIYSKGSDGVIRIGNADYEELVNRLYRYNVGIANGSTMMDDGELLDIVSKAASQSQSGNRIVNLLTAFQAQGSFGIKSNSYRNSNSTIGYMSGVELSDMLNTNDIEKNYTYKMTFGLDNSNDILDIVALDKNGKEVKNFKKSKSYEVITSYESSPFFKKDRVMTKIGYFNSRLSDAMVEYNDNGNSYINKYNNKIKKEFKLNGNITREKSYEIANEIVLDYQARTLDRYGFNTKFNNEDKEKYVQSFLDYYEGLSDDETTGHLDDFYNRIKYNLDVGTIAGNIYEGRLLDNLMTIGKQSKNTLDTHQIVSQAFLNPLFVENAQGQRKAQALDRLPPLVLNILGKEYNIADEMKTMFSGIQEMKYKSINFEYLQRKAMIEKLGSRVGITGDNIPKVSNSMIRVLYAETDLAFQDSSIYTNSAAMQIPAMFDNKKDFSVSYNALKRNVYGDITNEQLENFYNELRIKKYNISSLSKENKVIANTMLQNLLGEENYNKYVIGRKQGIIDELREVGSPIKNISLIEGNEIEYIKASDEMTGKFNSWLNKYFIKSDANSTINILNPEMVENSIATTISGSNYANFRDIQFTENGITFGINRTFIQGHGSKVMNDHIKSTTQVLTHLLGAKFNDGSKMFVEGIINEKYTKAKRGFTGTQFARILTTAAYNAINADYQNADLSTADKFNKFKSYMSNTRFPAKDGINNKMRNIFEILNIDMRFENGQIVFDDKNVQKAIDAFDYQEYESIDARIFDNLRKHRREIFGKDLVNDEGRILGAYAQELMAYAYSDLSKEMTENSRNRFKLYEEDFDLLKDYVTRDENGNVDAGLTNLGKIKRGWFLLSNNAMMMEPKKRKTEEGLKLGRLSALTLTELGMDNVVKYISDMGVRDKNVLAVADYISLAAPTGTEFARGTEYFTEAFLKQNIIDITKDVNIYNMSSLNDNIEKFLSDSPIGKLMDYDINEGRLRKKTQGIIQGFSQEYIDNLKSFFDINDREIINKKIFGFAGYSMITNSFHKFGLNPEHAKKINDINKLKDKITNKKLIESFSKTFDELEVMDQAYFEGLSINNKKLSDELYSNFLSHLYSRLDKKDASLLDEILSYSSETNFNIFKMATSIVAMKEQSLGKNGTQIFKGFNKSNRLKAESQLYNFNLNKAELLSLDNYYIKDYFKRDKNTANILRGFFKNFDAIKDNNIYNILELQQISKFGNIPFMIDSLNHDSNSNIVPNAELSNYSRIIKTAKELEELEKEKKDLQLIYGKKLDIDSDEYKKVLEESVNKREIIFSNYLKTIKDPEQLQDVKDELDNVRQIFKSGNIDINNISHNTFYNILLDNALKSKKKNQHLTSFVDNELSVKLYKFKKYVKQNSNRNSTIRKMLSNYGLTKSLDDVIISPNMSFNGIKLSDVQRNILNESFYGENKDRFSLDNFDKEIRAAKNNIKKINETDNYLEDVYSIEKFIKGMIGSVFKEQAGIGAVEYEDYLKSLQNGIPYEEFLNLTLGITGASSNKSNIGLFESAKNYVIENQSTLINNIENNINEKQIMLTSSLMTKLNGLYSRISTKGGALYEMSTIAERASSAFSPREASAMTTFMRSEFLDIMRNRSIDSFGKVNETQAYKDFKSALRLIYGDTLINDTIKKLDELYNIANPNNKDVYKIINATKERLDNFSHIVLGTAEDWENAGRSHLFATKNGLPSNVYYGLLSRNPHQYKLSVSPVRAVRLNDAAINLSFIGKYLGSGNKVQSTQSSLMMLGKLTALGAKGDFDGDTFQILSLGTRSLDINRLRGMTAKQFAQEFDTKAKLFHLMNNLAGEDLKTAFYSGQELSYSQQSLKRLISQVYFDGKNIDNKEAYNAIESVFLSLSHEKARVLQMLQEEIDDHKLIPAFKGFYGIKDGEKTVSKKAVGAFLLTVDDDVRNRYLQGYYDTKNLREMILNNKRLNSAERQELINAYEKDNGEFLLSTFKKIRDDKEVPLFQTIYEYINNYLAYTGIAKTGEVHEKLTNFREVIDTLRDEKNMLNFTKNLGIQETGNIFNPQVIADATMGHNIGDLIETLAISSKKGNVSPDISLKAFSYAEELMRKNELTYNAETVAKYNKMLMTDSNSKISTTLNDIKGKTLYNFFSELYVDTDAFVNKAGKEGLANQLTFKELMHTFLTISTGMEDDQIKKILDKSNSVKVGDIFENVFGNKFNSLKLVSILSTFSEPMMVGNYERVSKVDNLNRVDYNTIFGPAIKTSFRVATNLLDLIKIGDKGLGTRLNSAIFGKMKNRFEDLFNLKLSRSELAKLIEEKENESINDIVVESGKEYIDKTLEKQTVEEVIQTSERNISQDIPPSLENNLSQSIDSSSVEEVIKKTQVNKTNFETAKMQQMSFDFSNNIEEQSIKEIRDVPNNVETQKLTDDIQNQIKELKQEIEDLKASAIDKDKQVKSLNAIIATKQSEIEDLQNTNEYLRKESKKASNDASVVRKAMERAKEFGEPIVEEVKKRTNNDVVNAAKDKITKHKKGLAIAGGVAILASFFRIFQSNRPVVNLDINEQEYERSQGSLYRNLGQYTMNSNIRSLY